MDLELYGFLKAVFGNDWIRGSRSLTDLIDEKKVRMFL
jgi:hypothetical protein